VSGVRLIAFSNAKSGSRGSPGVVGVAVKVFKNNLGPRFLLATQVCGAIKSAEIRVLDDCVFSEIPAGLALRPADRIFQSSNDFTLDV
jgi:hypothetical protein